MKKIFLVLVLVLSLGLDILAQRNDNFFNNDNGDIYYRLEDPSNLLNMPTSALGSTTNEPAPLGSGLLVLTAIGLGYAIRKRK